VGVESTCNWYWLVDGLLEADSRVHLANPAAMQQYRGRNQTADRSDARGLAPLLRLGGLPAGYLAPTAQRRGREWRRKRHHLVAPQSAKVRRMQNILLRNTDSRLSPTRSKQLRRAALARL
jgi:transposase